MAKVLIIADDYTGANDTAITIHECGYEAFTVIDEERTDKDFADQVFCLSVSTASRAIPKEEAYKAVYKETEKFASVDTGLYSKRIDSTLRGNLGSEMDGMLDALGDDRMAIIVPGFIEAGRVYKEGLMYLHGELLHTTKAASQDVKTPVRSSSAYELMKVQTKRKLQEIRTAQYRNQEEALSKEINKAYAAGVRGLVFDCETLEDRELIAESVLKSDVSFIVMDPGGFSKAMTEKIFGRKPEAEEIFYPEDSSKKLLYVIGSCNDTVKRQTRILAEREQVPCIPLDMQKVLENEEACEEAIEKTVSDAAKENGRVIIVVTSGFDESCTIDFNQFEDPEAVSVALNAAIAKAAHRIMKVRGDIKALVLSGGDTAIGFCKEIGAYGEYPLKAVIPLMVYGTLQGGELSGLPIITKGGMIGTDDSLMVAADYLFTHIAN